MIICEYMQYIEQEILPLYASGDGLLILTTRNSCEKDLKTPC